MLVFVLRERVEKTRASGVDPRGAVDVFTVQSNPS